jgi:hypothetical protein
MQIKFVLPLLFFVLISCGTSKEPTIRKIVCGDSFPQEFFDSSGHPYTIMVPGFCDTIEISKDSAEALEHIEMLHRR